MNTNAEIEFEALEVSVLTAGASEAEEYGDCAIGAVIHAILH